MTTTTLLPADPNRVLRAGGAIYLAIIVLGLYGEIYARGTLIVFRDAAATAANIVAAEQRWRWGIAGDIVAHILDVPLLLILYGLLAPVSRGLAALAALFVLVQTAVLVTAKLAALVVLSLLGNAAYLQGVEPRVLQALAYVAVRTDSQGFGVGLVFFGCALLVNGHLIARSGYMPKLLGILLQVGGACYLVNSFAMLLSPPLQGVIFPAVLLPSFVAELWLATWLLFKGVDVNAWRQRTLQPSP